jgi:hypothetical protein
VSAGLRREILKDVSAERKPARLIGFGTALPTRSPLRYKPPRNQTQKRWLGCPTVPKDLESMQVAWEGITKLRYFTRSKVFFTAGGWTVSGVEFRNPSANQRIR